MKAPIPIKDTAGFTMVETMITVSISAIVGGMIFLVLTSGMNLYAKNTAVNVAHQQARTGVDQLLQNIHGSVSVPQLVDANLVPTGGSGPAAGVAFQRFEAGPFPVVAFASAAATSIDLASGTPGAYTPSPKARLIIAPHKIELDIASSSDLGNGKRRYNFASPIGANLNIQGNGQETNGYAITAFTTFRASYAVVGSELRYFPTNDVNNYRVITRNITASSALPFTIPASTGGAMQNRYVAAINITTADPKFSARGYAAVNMFINSSIPFRSRLTNYQ